MTMKFTKRLVLITVVVMVLVVLAMFRMTGSCAGSQSANCDGDHADTNTGRKIVAHAQNQVNIQIRTQTYNLIGNQTGARVGIKANNQKESKTVYLKENQTGDLVVNKADNQKRSKTVDLKKSQSSDFVGNKVDNQNRSKIVNFKKSQTGDLVGNKVDDNKGKQSIALAKHKTLIQEAMKAKRCIRKKITHIAFLKVHRAGSTTLEYMFYRFGMRNNLTFVLPKTPVSAPFKGETDDILPVKEGAHYDIFTCHSVYNRTKFKRLLPEYSMKIAIIRDPLERMVSAAYYYRDVMKLPYLLEVPKKNFIENLIRNPIYEKSAFSITKNSMAKDFGFPASTTRYMSTFISNYISKLTTDFNLVLVMEKFEESLVLMKRYLEWELFDILFIAAANYAHEPVSVSAADMAKFKSVSFLDYAIYEELSKVLEWKIMLEERTFKDEVDHFKVVLSSVTEFCNSGFEYIYIHPTKWNCPFIVTALDCKFIKMDPHVISMSILVERHKNMHEYK